MTYMYDIKFSHVMAVLLQRLLTAVVPHPILPHHCKFWVLSGIDAKLKTLSHRGQGSSFLVSEDGGGDENI